jgi:hypothetical protein
VKDVAEATVKLLKTVPGLEEENLAAKLKEMAEAYVAEHAEEEGVLVPVEWQKAEEPSVSEEGGAGEDAAGTEEPSVSEEGGAGEDAAGTEEPSVSEEGGAGEDAAGTEEPSVSEEGGAGERVA